ncbi:XrtY-associated glycosyltransferase XYAG1 [Rubrolithibacter danxiaensis]|uniref:XrtY-associated glycosyltransferase XYAG1 n=1 Tax=Rubrolithibacter danxiaensis TaxID=3390805 RepID=UPI003BF77D41
MPVKKLRILHITASYKPAYIYGGPIYSVAALCEALVKEGNLVDVYTTTANGTQELPVAKATDVDGVNVYYFKRITKDHTHFSPSLLIHLFRNAKQYEVIHIHSWWNLVSVLSAFVCVLRGVKPVLSPRGMLSEYSRQQSNSILKKLIHIILGKQLLKRVRFHATSEQEAEEIRTVFKERAIRTNVIYNLVYLPACIPDKLPSSNVVLKLLFLSRVHEKKGLEMLFQAIASLEFPFSLTIVGEGEKDYLELLKEKVKNLKISNCITWLDPVYGSKKFDLYSQFDLFVLPSYNENFANVVIESLSVGTPVLISKNVGLSAFVKSNKLGEVFDGSQEDLQLKIRKMMNDIADFNPERIRNTILNDFDSGKQVNNYLDLYNS